MTVLVMSPPPCSRRTAAPGQASAAERRRQSRDHAGDHRRYSTRIASSTSIPTVRTGLSMNEICGMV